MRKYAIWEHMRALSCICMHTQHWHYFISVFFSFNLFFFNFTFFKNKFQIYDILSVWIQIKKIPLSCLIWVHFVLGKNHQMTQIISRNHTAWGPIRCVGLLVNTAYPMQSVKTRMRCLSSVAFLKSPNKFKILWYNIVVNNGASRIVIIYNTKLMPYFHNL